MLEYNRIVKKRLAKLWRIALLIVPMICIVVLLSQTVFARSTYVISDGGRVLLHTTYATDPAKILNEAGLTLGEQDIITTQPAQGLSEIRIQRSQQITLRRGSETHVFTSYGESVGALLTRMKVILGMEDVLSVPLDVMTYDGMELVIAKSTQTTQTYTQTIPYDTVYCYDASLAEGEQLVLTPGKDGQLLCTAKVCYLDGVEVSRTILSQDVTRQPVDAIVAIGTYTAQPEQTLMPEDPDAVKDVATPVPSIGTVTTASGEVLSYTQKLDVQATAYSCDGKPGITYSGTPARVGAIAVDPEVIPLGTRMYIVSNDGEYIYGIATAEDIGSAVKGNKIDLYFDTFAECYEFGLRDCTVYILG
jgi:3D (Asp-Asp-Asp) domain-containing protein/uncharacterized protein YabE (DUF348 family)